MIDTSLARFGIYIADTLSVDMTSDLVGFIDENIGLFEDESQRGEGYNTKALGITFGHLHASGVADAKAWDEAMFEAYVGDIAAINEILPFPVMVDADSGYNLRKFESGKDTGMHIDNLDSDGQSVRSLTAVTFLNSNEFEGGELVFPLQDLIVKPNAGQTVFFPPYWTHPHYAKAVNSGSRYTINTWFRHAI